MLQIFKNNTSNTSPSDFFVNRVFQNLVFCQIRVGLRRYQWWVSLGLDEIKKLHLRQIFIKIFFVLRRKSRKFWVEWAKFDPKILTSWRQKLRNKVQIRAFLLNFWGTFKGVFVGIFRRSIAQKNRRRKLKGGF